MSSGTDYPLEDPSRPHPWSVGLPMIDTGTGERIIGVTAVESPRQDGGIITVTFSDGQRKMYQTVTDIAPVGREEVEVALDGIAALLSGEEWDSQTASDVARIVRATGREVAEPNID